MRAVASSILAAACIVASAIRPESWDNSVSQTILVITLTNALLFTMMGK